MHPQFPTESELNALALKVDDQLKELLSQPPDLATLRGPANGEPTKLPAAPQQQEVIEQTTGEPFETFWEKYKRHARRDLCLPGGRLHEQWQKWRDLRSKDSLKLSLAALAGMGISTASIPTVAVAASVILINTVTSIGIDAICDGCAEEEAERKKAAKRKNRTP